MKRSALVLICLAGLLAALPCLAATAAPPPAPANAVSPALQLDAPAAAPLPSWLAPPSASEVVAPALSADGAARPLFVSACTFQFCKICEGCCRVSGGCVCC